MVLYASSRIGLSALVSFEDSSNYCAQQMSVLLYVFSTLFKLLCLF